MLYDDDDHDIQSHPSFLISHHDDENVNGSHYVNDGEIPHATI